MDLKTCPYCKTEVPKDATRCRACGKDISAGGMLLQAGCALFVIGAAILIVLTLLR